MLSPLKILAVAAIWILKGSSITKDLKINVF